MTYEFLFDSNNSLPKLKVDGERVRLINLELIWETRTTADTGTYSIYVKGFYDGETKIREFSIDQNKNECKEI